MPSGFPLIEPQALAAVRCAGPVSLIEPQALALVLTTSFVIFSKPAGAIAGNPCVFQCARSGPGFAVRPVQRKGLGAAVS